MSVQPKNIPEGSIKFCPKENPIIEFDELVIKKFSCSETPPKKSTISKPLNTIWNPEIETLFFI